jgi:predicted nucleotidyltransferase
MVLPEITPEMIEMDHQFWRQYSTRLIGDWITYDTTVQEIADFAVRLYLRRDYRGFEGDRKFIRDDNAQKAFSKLRSSIGGIYAWRLGTSRNPAEQQRMLKEAEFAFKQSFAFCPYSPEAVYRFVQLLTQQGRMDEAIATDPRLRRWRQRLAARVEEALDALAAVRGVVGLVLGGSYGRGEAWPLSDLDVMVISAGRPIAEVSAEVDRRAYQLSEMWGTSGIYTSVDAGRLTFDEAEVRDPGDILARMDDSRWLHGLDKMYGGIACRDGDGAAAALLDLSTRWRFEPAVVECRIEAWLIVARKLLANAQRLAVADRIGAWIAIRGAASAISEVATERWGERAGSLGRAWTLFEARADRHGDSAFADWPCTAAYARPTPAPHAIPEWLADRIALSYEARQLIGENVTPEQNARDNLLAYAGLYRGRFPTAAYAWMGPPPDADLFADISTLQSLAH